jgi:hypothetical protein
MGLGARVTLQDCKSLLLGVVLVCGVMLAGPLTSQASPSDPFGAVSGQGAKPKPRVWIAERFGAMLSGTKVTQTAFDLGATTTRDFGDWDEAVRR